jgi:hypothetical protein
VHPALGKTTLILLIKIFSLSYQHCSYFRFIPISAASGRLTPAPHHAASGCRRPLATTAAAAVISVVIVAVTVAIIVVAIVIAVAVAATANISSAANFS